MKKIFLTLFVMLGLCYNMTSLAFTLTNPLQTTCTSTYGGTWNSSTNSCTCPTNSGSSWNGSACACPSSGYTWNSTSKKCESPASKACTATYGGTWSYSTNSCTCPGGANWNGLQCVTCPANSTWNTSSKQCLCNTNYTSDGTQCVSTTKSTSTTTPTCPTYSTWDGTQCVCISSDYQLDPTTNQCVVKPTAIGAGDPWCPSRRFGQDCSCTSSPPPGIQGAVCQNSVWTVVSDLNGTKCPLNSHVSQTDPTKCECDTGYTMDNGQCVVMKTSTTEVISTTDPTKATTNTTDAMKTDTSGTTASTTDPSKTSTGSTTIDSGAKL